MPKHCINVLTEVLETVYPGDSNGFKENCGQKWESRCVIFEQTENVEPSLKHAMLCFPGWRHYSANRSDASNCNQEGREYYKSGKNLTRNSSFSKKLLILVHQARDDTFKTPHLRKANIVKQYIFLKLLLTALSMPSMISMKKKMTDQNWLPGRVATAWG